MNAIAWLSASAGRLRRAAVQIGLLILFASLAACTNKAAGPTNETGPDVMLVSPDVISFYEGKYSSLKRPGAMAVSSDGLHIGYSLCPEYQCRMYPSATELALQACARAGGLGCRIFAVGQEIKVKYRVMGQ